MITLSDDTDDKEEMRWNGEDRRIEGNKVATYRTEPLIYVQCRVCVVFIWQFRMNVIYLLIQTLILLSKLTFAYF